MKFTCSLSVLFSKDKVMFCSTFLDGIPLFKSTNKHQVYTNYLHNLNFCKYFTLPFHKYNLPGVKF